MISTEGSGGRRQEAVQCLHHPSLFRPRHNFPTPAGTPVVIMSYNNISTLILGLKIEESCEPSEEVNSSDELLNLNHLW